jgi:hypothetical protein
MDKKFFTYEMPVKVFPNDNIDQTCFNNKLQKYSEGGTNYQVLTEFARQCSTNKKIEGFSTNVSPNDIILYIFIITIIFIFIKFFKLL